MSHANSATGTVVDRLRVRVYVYIKAARPPHLDTCGLAMLGAGDCRVYYRMFDSILASTHYMSAASFLRL